MSQEIERIRELVGKNGQVLGAVSGGVDSTVAAKLMVCISDVLYSSLGSLAHALLNFYHHVLQGKKAKAGQKEAIGSRFWAVLVNSMYF
jgi:NH3-dependent NAD+ synthetase